MNGRVRAKILLVIMILLIVVLAMNKQRVNILERNEKLIKTTTQTKEKLLEKESKENSNTITGSVYEKETGEFKEGIEVELYEAEEEKKVEIAYTDKDGNYKFSNVKKGEYVVGITDKNYEASINNNVTVENQNSQDVNIEIEEKDEFKAEIKKYIKEIKINNNGKEETYNYDRQDKVNLPIKNLKNLTGEITYEFEVTNKKEKEGTVKVIKDILPEGLSFKKEKNENWREKDGKLYTSVLSKETIKKGETKKVQLVLDINNTDEARRYLNKVSITGEVYHKVVYDSLGTVYKEEDVIDGSIIEKIEEPKIDGYIFDGFYENKKLTKEYDFDEPIIKDTTIYLGFKKELSVTYVIDEQVYKDDKVKEGDKAKKPETPNIDGYTFDGWYEDKEFTKEYDFDKPITKDTIIYGKTTKEVKNYKVTYKIDNEVWQEETIKSGTKAEDKIGPDKPSKEQNGRLVNFQFEGWYTDEQLSEKYNFNDEVTSDLILYGKYIETKACITKENIKVPTKEEIISSLKTKEQIIQEVEERYKEINLTSSQTESSNGIDYVISDGFKAKYKDNGKNSYEIVDYIKESLPDTIKIPDKINNVPVVKISGGFNEKNIKTIKISKTLQEIGGNTFESSTIVNIDFSDAIGLIKIGDNSFKNAKFEDEEENPVDVNLKNTVNLTTIQSGFNGIHFKDFKFGNSYSLTNIVSVFSSVTGNNILLENTIATTQLGSGFISNNSNIKVLDLGNMVNLSQLTGGFVSSSNIDTVKFNNTVSLNTISGGSFGGSQSSGTSKISNLNFENAVNIQQIDSGAFSDVLDIDTLTLKSTNELQVMTGAFSRNKIRNLIIGAGVSKFESQSFRNNQTESINFDCAKDLTYIGEFAFSDNNIGEFKLENIPGLYHIEASIFSSNPITLVSLKNLPSLTKLERMYGGSFDTFSPTEFDFIIDNIPLEKIDKWTLYNVNVKKLIIKNIQQLTTIEDYAFGGNSKLQDIVLENLPNLEQIGDKGSSGLGTFVGASKVQNLKLQDLPSLKVIGCKTFFQLSSLESLTLKNLESLESIEYAAFDEAYSLSDLNLENLPKLTTIGAGAFRFSIIEEVILDGQDLPKLTDIGIEAFSQNKPGHEKKLKHIKLSNLPLFNPKNALGNIFEFTVVERFELINLDSLTQILTPGMHSSQDSTLIIKDCDNLNLGTGGQGQFNQSNIANLILDNLPATTSLSVGMFNGNKIKNIDLSKLTNLTNIGSSAFSGNPIKNIKLPESLQTIGTGTGAFQSTDTIDCIEIHGDSNRFNDVWTDVGFPESLTPGTCVFVDEEDASLKGILGSIIGLENKTEKENYSVVLFKMDSNKLIDDNKNYKLTKLNVDKYENVNMEEDYDGVGRYNLNNESKDLIKPYKNKIYISNIETGLYKLVNEDDENDTLTFIVEQGGTVTGNARISGVPTSDKIVSEAQAELITSIQTGVTRIRYLFILVILTIGLSILVYKQKKYIN